MIHRRHFLQATAAGTVGMLAAPVLRTRAATEIPIVFPNVEQPFRQIHMDFHTSRFIEDVGAEFDPDAFADTLKRAHVNSINCFGRCHHGFVYWDTQAFKDRKHPHLVRPLLNAQIEALHKRDIRVTTYITVQWDYLTARSHPEWLMRQPDGRHVGSSFEDGFYQQLCVNTPYRAYLEALIRDLYATTPTDGLWPDIVKTLECSCEACQRSMRDAGMNPKLSTDRQAFATRMMRDFKMDTTRLIQSLEKRSSVFYNSGHIGPALRDDLPAYSHLEMESLPSGSWGYLHLPLTARYVRTLGKEYLGMTGKFHTAWGDFHSFKNAAALQFECFTMLALGAKCCVGDQLHPNGKIDPVTYDLIGSVYAEVEKKEPWCTRARAVCDIGVVTPEEFVGGRTPPAAKGAVRMLQEGAHQFDMVDSRSDYAPYKVLILPDVIPVSPDLAQRLQTYLAGGGTLLASFESGLQPDKQAFALAELGVTKTGDGPRDPAGALARGRAFDRNQYAEYVIPQGAMGVGLPETEHVMYMKGLDVEAQADAEVLARVVAPYFDRTPRQFCSHRQTPSSGRNAGAAVVRRGGCVYLSHPVFSQYDHNAPRWCRQWFLNALNLLLAEPAVRHNGPSTLLATLNEQPLPKRRVLHLLHYLPERRGESFDVLEDVIPLYDVALSVRIDHPTSRVRLVPEGRPLPHQVNGSRIVFTVDKIQGHQMVELS